MISTHSVQCSGGCFGLDHQGVWCLPYSSLPGWRLVIGGPGTEECTHFMDCMLSTCGKLAIPLALDKVEGPAYYLFNIPGHWPGHKEHAGLLASREAVTLVAWAAGLARQKILHQERLESSYRGPAVYIQDEFPRSDFCETYDQSPLSG